MWHPVVEDFRTNFKQRCFQAWNEVFNVVDITHTWLVCECDNVFGFFIVHSKAMQGGVSKHTNMCLTPFLMPIFENLSLQKSGGTRPQIHPFPSPTQADSLCKVSFYILCYPVIKYENQPLCFYDNFQFHFDFLTVCL